ncbi:MAG: methylenetetrahydrofolate reductase [NAD(P)H] [Burkholderiales bacterium]|nr:methylenetetrahydrofolate reductase [NAD(P)H] [Burkholderiales bacterium]
MPSQIRTTGSFSFEFFPPKTPEGEARLRSTWAQLAKLSPEFFSVTYGAGGSTRERTLQTVLEIRAAGHEAAPHLSCVGATRADIASVLDQYRACGIRRMVALRGDMPSGAMAIGELRYASELVAFVRAHTDSHFRIAVACYPEYHPQARSPREDLAHFKQKVVAGADMAITQYFYNADGYFRFVDACRSAGIDIPIFPGIMPIGNFSQLARFSETCGAEIPRWLRLKMESFGDDLASIREFGLEAVSALSARLLEGGAPGLHFYSMNRADLITEIWKRLDLPG